jgi:hypothetical protein
MRKRFWPLAGLTLALLAAGCSSTSSSSANPAPSYKPPQHVSYDWIPIDGARNDLAAASGLPHLAPSRFHVLWTIQQGPSTTWVMQLDGGTVPHINRSAEASYYAAARQVSHASPTAWLSPWGSTVWLWPNLSFRLTPNDLPYHYVLLLPKQDAWIIAQLPSQILGPGMAATVDFDTSSLTVLTDLGSLDWNTEAAATEACQATVAVLPTASTLHRIDKANAVRHPAADVKALASDYYDLGQETACNEIGQALYGRRLGLSYAAFVHNYPNMTIEAKDGKVGMVWSIPRSMYVSLPSG